MRFSSLPQLCLVAGCAFLLGCSGTGAPVCDVSGTILFDGQPVPTGRIFFNPDVAQKNDGPQGRADIKNGQFDTRAGGRPAVSGPVIVRIEGYDLGPDGTSAGKKLFVEYEIKLELPKDASTHKFEVPASAAKGLTPNTGSGF